METRQAMLVDLKRRRFTVEEYHRMGEVGILTDADRVELIDGEIVEMTPIGAAHARCVMFLNELFVRRLEGRALVAPQLSLRLTDWTEPEPDVALLRPPLDRYGRTIPVARDALLVVEVADTSLHYDRTVKLPRYAAAGAPEAWIVDLNGGAVEAYREPWAEGYRHARRLERGSEIAPTAFPDIVIAVDDILG
jgi:Uma2 family endonuclease